jgi:hypothetical protein
MVLRAEIVGKRPGFAQLQVRGLTEESGALRLQIRRNQGPEYYLGKTGRWQTTPDSWFSVQRGDWIAQPSGFDLPIGPQIVDPIVGSLAGCAFKLVLEASASPATAPLTIARSPALLASGAATEEPEEPVPAPAPAQVPLTADPTEGPLRPEPAPRSSLWRWVLLIIALVIIAAVIAGYRFQAELQQFLGLSPLVQAPAVPVPVPAPAPPSPPAKSSMEQLKDFMTQNPDRKGWAAMAAQKLAACDLNWATTLYRELGESGDTDAAVAMGRIYDPEEHLCPNIAADQHPVSADTAAFWYQKGVSANSPEAMRRLGLLWTKPGKDGPHYAEGVDLLKRAAGLGDADATEALKRIGQ